MQLKETQEALVAAAQEGFTIGNATLSLFHGDNTTQLSNVNPVLIGNATDFAMLADQHYCFRRPPNHFGEIGTYNHTIDAINDLPSILRPRACAALSQGCAILGTVLEFAVDYICSLSAGQT